MKPAVIKTSVLLCASALLVLATSSCSNVSYYAQAVGGHFELMKKRESVKALLAAEDTDPELKSRLQLLVDARVYAVEQLGLPENDSYATYVETGRDFVTWNVIAAPEFSVNARTWCFPVAGCVSYRGYFAKEDAEQYAEKVAAEGFDTTISGASAYSTLGWFDDPLLDTMLRGDDTRLVGVLFHELAHQQLYVKNDSNFNEAFASFVEQAGTRRWLEDQGRSAEIERYNARLQRQRDFTVLLKSTRDALKATYSETHDQDPELRRQKKAEVFENMRKEYAAMKARWQGYSGYDGWFARELNNARLVAVATYYRWVPAFAAIFEEEGRDFTRFYRRVQALAEMDKPARDKALLAYLPEQGSV